MRLVVDRNRHDFDGADAPEAIGQVYDHRPLKRHQELNRLREFLLGRCPFTEKLKEVTESVVKAFDADFCRIWIIKSGDLCESNCEYTEVSGGPYVCRSRDKCLHLMASSGRYKHVDRGIHRRIPFGCHNVGRLVAGSDNKFFTNSVTRDARIHDSQWAERLGLTAFAGYKLTDTEGSAIGVLAVFSRHQIQAEHDIELEGIAKTVSQVIQTWRAEEALRLTQFSVDSATDAVYWIRSDARFIYVNNAACRTLGYSQEELLKIAVYDISPEITLEAWPSHWEKVRKQGSLLFESIHRTKNGRVIPVEIASRYLEFDGVEYNCAFVRDITERKRVERELKAYADQMEVLLREVNHRVKNNLFAIIGMLYKEEACAKKGVPLGRDVFGGVINRIEGLSTVHTLLSASGWRSLKVSELCNAVIRGAAEGRSLERSVSLVVAPSEVTVDSSQAHHLTLVINELATNSLKYAYDERDTILIEVRIHDDNEKIRLEYRDDGPGYPVKILEGDFSSTNVGLDLVLGIVKQSLRGAIQFKNRHGAVATISFKSRLKGHTERI